MWRALVCLIWLLGGCGFFAAYLVTGHSPPVRELSGLVRVPEALAVPGNENGALVGAEVSALVASESVVSSTTERGGTFRLSFSPSLNPTVVSVKQGSLILLAPVASWVEVSPGSTALLKALAMVDTQLVGQLDAGLSLRVARLLDQGMPTDLAALQTRMETWGQSFAIALSEKSIEAQAIASSPPLRLKVAIANQILERLLALDDPQKIAEACVSLDYKKAISQASSPYLVWGDSIVATLSSSVTLGDPALRGQVTVQVSSLAEPLGETVTLYETAAGSGTFQGNIPLIRLYNSQGIVQSSSVDGKLTVYAEGSTAQMMLVARYGDFQAYTTYREPPNTLTGVIPFVGADVSAKMGTMAYHTVSRSDGSYAFYDLPSGEYLVVAKKDGQAVSEYRKIP